MVPTETPTLWEGAQLQRDFALASAEEHAPIGWNDTAYQFLEGFLREHAEMHVDELWDAGLPAPPEQRAIGAVIQRAARAGLMRRSGRTRPSVRSHLAHKPVWESLIYAGPKW